MDKIDLSAIQTGRVRETGSWKDKFRVSAADITLFAAVAVAAVISLGEIKLNISTVSNMTLLVSLLYVLTTLVYRNRYTVSLERGKATVKYREAYAEYDSLRRSLYEAGLSERVSGFCSDFVSRELAEYRSGLLAEAGVEYADYINKYRGQGALRLRKNYRLSPYAVKAIVRCDHAKGVRLNKNMILLNDGDTSCRSKPFGFSSKAKQRRDYRVNVISRLIVTLLSGVIAVSFIIDPSIATLVQWCVRMVPVLSAAFFGSVSGFTNGSETAVNYLAAQSLKIREIFEWAGVKIPEPCGDEPVDHAV